jgi:hypothetical protein
MVVRNQNPEANKVLIYFHGNAEDIGVSLMFMAQIGMAWNVG